MSPHPTHPLPGLFPGPTGGLSGPMIPFRNFAYNLKIVQRRPCHPSSFLKSVITCNYHHIGGASNEWSNLFIFPSFFSFLHYFFLPFFSFLFVFIASFIHVVQFSFSLRLKIHIKSKKFLHAFMDWKIITYYFIFSTQFLLEWLYRRL